MAVLTQKSGSTAVVRPELRSMIKKMLRTSGLYRTVFYTDFGQLRIMGSIIFEVTEAFHW